MPLEAIELTQQLIRIPSDKEELPLVEHIENVVDQSLPFKFKTQRIQTDHSRRPSLIVANSDRPNLILVAHGDSQPGWAKVEYGEIGQGVFDPYGAEIV